MKFAKRTISVLLAVLMLVSILPLSVSAASLKITTQPKTSYTEYGATAKATIKATGDGLKYTWYVKNAGSSKYTKSSVTKSTYTAKMTDSVKSRSVYCVVKDKKGKTVKSSTAILRMKATITTEPKTTYAQQGATAKLTVKAKGDGLKYAWYIKNAGKTKYTKSSVTKSTYSTTMSDSVHGRYVYCIVTDKYGKTDKSKTVVLRQSATIVTQPKTTSAALGETAKLTVKAKGDGLKYAWYIKNAGGSKYSKSSVTKSTYSVTMSEKVNGRYVYCVVTDKYGKTEKSKTVALKLKADPLTITTQPEDVTCKVGDIATFTVQVAGGKAPYTYQWQCYCEGDGDFWWDIEADMDWAGGYNTPSLGIEVSPADFVDVTKYRCVITDAAGNQVISNEVEVIEAETPLTITMQPETVTCRVGDEVGFGVVVKGGTAPYTYQWEYTVSALDGWQAVPEEAIYITGDMVSAVLPVVQSHFDFDFRIRCVITDAKGAQVTTNEAGLIQAFDELAFNVPPQTVTASVGDEVSFYPIVEGGKLPYTYQWQIKGALGTEYVNLEEGQYQGVTEDYFHFVVNDFEFDNGNTYRVIVTDANGTQLISDPVWVEKAEDPLTIVTQPQNVTAKVDDTVSFSVAVSGGTEPYAYQWQYKFGTLDWRDITGGWASGVQTERLSFAVDQDEYGNYYRCVITDADGNQVISDAAWVVEALDSLTIVTQPQNVTAKVGDTVSFSVAVSGGKAPYTYLWQIQKSSGDYWTYIVSSGDSGEQTERLSFVVDDQHEFGNYKYRCIIIDANGKQIISNKAWVEEALTIVTQPQNVTAQVGDRVSFSVAVSGGTEPYAYQWQYRKGSSDWKDIPDSWVVAGEQTESMSFFVNNNNELGSYKYRCVITDAKGNQVISDEAWVEKPLTIVTQPQNIYAKAGDEVNFLAEVEGGKAPYTYQWQIHSVGNGDVWSNIPLDAAWASGQQTERLSFVVGQYEHGRYQYRCIITDAKGNQVISDAAGVEKALTISSQPKNVTAEITDTVSFSVTVSGGKAPYTYQWEFTHDGLSVWQKVQSSWATGGTSNTLSFRVDGNYEWNDHYTYRCVITDAAGNQIISNEAWVVNANALRITSQPVNDYGRHGQQNTFTVQVAGGTGPYTYQWQWSDYSQPWRDITNNEFYSGAKTNTLDVIVMEVDFDNETKYRCIITDAQGNQVITNAVWSIEY